MRYRGFIGPAYESQSLIASCATLYNWYLEQMEVNGAKSPAVFYPTPGFEQFASVAQITGSAIFSTAASATRCFAVVGARLYEIFADGSTTERGTVAIDDNPATICTNGDGGNQLFITSGGNGYCYDLNANTLSQVTNLNGIATMGGFLDGLFLSFDRTTSTVYLSDYYDGTVFDPVNFFQRSSRSDSWLAMWVTSWGQIFLPGAKTRDYWFNAQLEGGQPFAPTTSGTQPDGIAATFSMAENAGTLAWLQTNKDGGYQVMAAQGYRGERISNHAVEHEIATYTRVDNAIGETYTARGHKFYLLTFPTPGVTWCVDLDSGTWHKRSTRDAASGTRMAWRARFHCFAFNKHLWVDAQSGKIWEADETFPLDVDGLTIDRERTAPSICNGHERLYFGTFELLMQTGIGNQTGVGTDPVVGLSLSDDGGMTWGSERAQPAGRIGAFKTRVKWERNGSARDRAARIRVSDPVYPWAIVDCFWAIQNPQGQDVRAA